MEFLIDEPHLLSNPVSPALVRTEALIQTMASSEIQIASLGRLTSSLHVSFGLKGLGFNDATRVVANNEAAMALNELITIQNLQDTSAMQ